MVPVSWTNLRPAALLAAVDGQQTVRLAPVALQALHSRFMVEGFKPRWPRHVPQTRAKAGSLRSLVTRRRSVACVVGDGGLSCTICRRVIRMAHEPVDSYQDVPP